MSLQIAFLVLRACKDLLAIFLTTTNQIHTKLLQVFERTPWFCIRICKILPTRRNPNHEKNNFVYWVDATLLEELIKRT